MKKHRADTVKGALEVIAMAGQDVSPPDSVPLSDDDMPFFDAVVAEFARSEWTDHSLQMAAMLARMMCDMEREQRVLRTEGSVAFSEKGTPVVNPRKTVVQMLSGSILSMRRSLAIHAHAQKGELRDIKKRNSLAKDIEQNSSLNDELIARPSVN